MKRCPKCGIVKSRDEYGFRDKAHTRIQSYCRDCQNAAWRDWYAQPENNARHRRLVSRRRKRRVARHREIVLAAKSVPCADCGQEYPPYVMDLDHIGEKRGEVSRIMYVNGTEALDAEIEQCEAVCANCHRFRTEARRQANAE